MFELPRQILCPSSEANIEAGQSTIKVKGYEEVDPSSAELWPQVDAGRIGRYDQTFYPQR